MEATIRHYTAEDYVQMPWKNGAGMTTELARSGSAEGYDWRLSIADISEDGPFSSFPGCARVITVLEGAGMQLTVDGKSSGALGPFTAFAFDGDSRTGCTLVDGPIRDFNLIYRKNDIRSRFRWVELSVPQDFATSAPTVLIFAATGHVLLRHSAAEQLHLDAQDLAEIENASGSSPRISLDGGPDGRASVIELWPLELRPS